MSGLPDDLRSHGATFANETKTQALLYTAADELDDRAARILRLESCLLGISREVARASLAYVPPDPPDEWVQDLEMKVEEPPTPTLTLATPLTPLRIDIPGGGTIWISR